MVNITRITLLEASPAKVARHVDSYADGNASEDGRDLIRQDRAGQRVQRLRASVPAGFVSGPVVADTRAERDDLAAIARGDMA